MSFAIAPMTTAPPAAPDDVDPATRIEAFVREHHGFAWRCLRRLGLSPADADDAAQRVFLVAVGRLSEIAPGCERAFLFRTAAHIAARARRSAGRQSELLREGAVDQLDDVPAADELLDRRRARELLDRVLGEISHELAAVIILFEIEGLTTAEVSMALDLPVGTVASRLRRARNEVEQRVSRYLARTRLPGAPR